MVTLLVVATAFATPEWTFDSPRRYLVEMKVETPYVMWLVEGKKGEARASYVSLAAVLECAADETLSKGKGWGVRCTVPDASFYAMPVQGDEGRAVEAVKQYEALLEASTVEFRLLKNGKLSRVHLGSVVQGTPRDQFAVDQQSRFLELALSPLDAWLPKEGITVGKSYPQSTFRPGKIPISVASMGAMKATQTVVSMDGGSVVLGGGATGAIQVDMDSWKLNYVSQTEFSKGGVQVAEASLNTVPNSNSIGPNQVSYRMWARVRAMAADDTVVLEPSAEF